MSRRPSCTYRMYVMYVRTYICLYERMYVCMYVCMYVYMYVCLYVYVFVCVYLCYDFFCQQMAKFEAELEDRWKDKADKMVSQAEDRWKNKYNELVEEKDDVTKKLAAVEEKVTLSLLCY